MTAAAHDMATFASRQNLTAAEAVAVPAVFDKAAAVTGLHVRALLAQATYTNPRLGEHLADLCRKVSAMAMTNDPVLQAMHETPMRERVEFNSNHEMEHWEDCQQ